jgi:hypothetical protein
MTCNCGFIAAGEQVAKSDGDGLTFTLSGAGTASWVLRYRQPGGRRKELTIGNYRMFHCLQRGSSPEHIGCRSIRSRPRCLKRSKTRDMQAWTVADLVEDYRAKVLTTSNYAKDTVYYREADINQVVLPRLGAWQVFASHP